MGGWAFSAVFGHENGEETDRAEPAKRRRNWPHRCPLIDFANGSLGEADVCNIIPS